MLFVPGGTVDVTVHEISENGKLKELYKASGGAWGGDKVNEKYCSFLEQIVGKQVLTKFKEESMSAWMNMLRDFEQIKRGLSKPQADDDEDEIFVRLEHDLIEEYEKHNGISLQEAFRLKKVKNPQGAMSRQKTVLEIPKTVVLEWIKSISKDIMNHVDDLLNNLNGNISFIIMVGGFSNSPILQDDVSSVRDIDVIVPEEAELSVVKGAVLFGWNPHIVTARRSKYSYGTRVCVSFNSDDHEEERKETTGTGKSYCEVLDKFMEEMQEVKVGDIVKRVYRPISSEQTSILVDIYYSQDKKVKYHNESGCNFLGNVRVPLPKSTNGKSRPSVCVCFTFGDTELHVDAEDTASGEKYADGSFNFISEWLYLNLMTVHMIVCSTRIEIFSTATDILIIVHEKRKKNQHTKEQ